MDEGEGRLFPTRGAHVQKELSFTVTDGSGLCRNHLWMLLLGRNVTRRR